MQNKPSASQNKAIKKELVPSVSVEKSIGQNRLHLLLKFLPDPVLAFSLKNKVEYINPEFEKVFGWNLKEVKGKNINFIPDHEIEQTRVRMRELLKNSSTYDFETQRYTKDGKLLDILINGSMLYDENSSPSGLVLVLRDLTAEKRMIRSNQILLKISLALHQFKKLGDLVSFINKEVQKLVAVEGSFIMLADKPKEQLYFLSARYRDAESEKKFQKIRFPDHQGVSGRVYKSGMPLIIPDVSNCSFFLKRINEETDLKTRNMLSVPLKLQDNTIGVLTVANKLHGEFDKMDIELLSMVINNIALPIENARIHEELQRSYKKVKTLGNAKDRVVNHLAHELKTPISVLGASIKLLAKKYRAEGLDSQPIHNLFERGLRNLNRILDIQYEVEDLLKKKDVKPYKILNRLVESCRDELITLVESETEDTGLLSRISEKIDSVFGPRERYHALTIKLDDYIPGLVEKLRPDFAHRNCFLNLKMAENATAQIPVEILDTVAAGLIRNAVEYTPDNGKIDIIVKKEEKFTEMIISDYGIGFTREKLDLMFENYFIPPESKEYSTKKAYDFNAGGSGFDLLRIKIFSESYNFRFWIHSNRCGVIPNDTNFCPGNIDLCQACKTHDDCFKSGNTSVHIRFEA